jgi:phosphatidylglycerol---prolipoprotein diacylglyceryl transferase
MTFPVYIYLFGLHLHPHWVFETLAYFLGFRIYLMVRQKFGDPIESGVRCWAIAAAAAGAAAGSKLLFLLEDPQMTTAHWSDLAYVMGGKTIVGGIIGGWVAVEWVKSRIRENTSTGDLFAVPLCVGMAIGRIGCFLTGLDDHTFGVATSLHWGVNFGDGIARHPTQLYEIVFLSVLGAALLLLQRRPHRNGDIFKYFMLAYMSWRVGIGYLQPERRLLGLSAIQSAALATVLFYIVWFARRRNSRVTIGVSEPTEAQVTHG